jgi:hypothetical protein
MVSIPETGSGCQTIKLLLTKLLDHHGNYLYLFRSIPRCRHGSYVGRVSCPAAAARMALTISSIELPFTR